MSGGPVHVVSFVWEGDLNDDFLVTKQSNPPTAHMELAGTHLLHLSTLKNRGRHPGMSYVLGASRCRTSDKSSSQSGTSPLGLWMSLYPPHPRSLGWPAIAHTTKAIRKRMGFDLILQVEWEELPRHAGCDGKRLTVFATGPPCCTCVAFVQWSWKMLAEVCIICFQPFYL